VFDGDVTENQPYEIVADRSSWQVRHYPPHLLAEVEVSGDFTDAGNRAFGVLVSFISGNNVERGKVSMTAPVLQESAPDDAPTTPSAPHEDQDGDLRRHRVAFVMPSEYSLETLPVPNDPRITIRQMPAQDMAARTFSGRWTEKIYRDQLARLRHDVAASGLEVLGTPRFARFDPPWKPSFLRRNEVLLPVAATPTA
jgi:hypothetical protein